MSGMLRASLAVAIFLAAALPASATTVGFKCITNNTGACSTFEGDFTADFVVSGTTLNVTLHNAATGTGIITLANTDNAGGLITGYASPGPQGRGSNL
jgi:hypothetical protein